MKTTIHLLAILLIALGCACVAPAATTTALTPLSSFGMNSDGSVRPGDSSPPYPPVTIGTASTGYQRGYAYDPVTGTTVLVDPNVGSTGDNPNFQGGVYVIDGIYGTNISTLETNGIYGGTYPASAVGVADDGVVYMGNAVNASDAQGFIIYRWDSVWQSNVPPSMAFSNSITPSQRYGATLDVRGSGAGTQIILGSRAQGGTSGTNVTVFTTADGTNFTAIPLGTDVTSADFADGIAFGSGDTFWAKSVGAFPLRVMSFNLTTSNATTLASFDTNALPGSASLGPIALDLDNKLLAAIERVGATVGPQRVWLYDITATLADPTKAPVLLDIKPFASQNTFASAPNGFLDFGAGKLYAHAINNGLLTFTNEQVATPVPTVLIQPATTNRILVGQSFRLTTLAMPAVTYQWQKGGTDIPGATSPTYSISSLALSDAGVYRCAITNAGGYTYTTESGLAVINPADLYHLNLLWSAAHSSGMDYVHTNGGSSGTPNQRTIAYNALSNELYVVSRQGQSSGNYRIYALPATNFSATAPIPTKSLNTNGIAGGLNNLLLIAIGCGSDGVIYACNVDNTGNWKLYKWDNSDPSTVPQLVYGPANPAPITSARWGDVMHVRGTGADTQIIIDQQNITTTSKGIVCVLTPTDAYATNFVSAWNALDGYAGATTIGRSLQWDTAPANSFWQRRRGAAATPLMQSSFDSGGSVAYVLGSYSSGWPATSFGPVYIDFARNVLVGIDFGTSPHSLKLYDVTDLNGPLLINAYSFPQVPPAANANYIGQCIIAGDYVFAIDANNGLMAYQIAAGPPTPPNFTQDPQDLHLVEGGSGTMTVAVDQTASFQWQRDGTNIAGATASSYTISYALPADATTYRCIATNAFGADTSAVATVTVALTNEVYRLSQIWSASPVGGPVYATSDGGQNSPRERYIAFNTPSNQLLVVQRDDITIPTTYSVHVVDGSTGTWLHELRTDVVIVHNVVSEVSGSSGLGLDAIAVADDGAIYACNLTPNASGGTNLYDPNGLFRVYRWANSDPTTAPVEIFSGDPANQTLANVRWGDAFNVRGSGINTEIILDSRLGDFGAILKPTDGSMTTFSNFWWNSFVGTGTLGRSLEYAGPSACWQKRKGDGLKYSTFDTNANTSVLVTNYSNFPATLGGVAVDTARNLAVGLDFVGTAGSSPDAVGLYDITDPNAPWLMFRYSFPANKTANANFFGNTLIVGNRVFSLNGNNGILAFDLIPPAPPQGPALNVTLSGSQVLLYWTSSATGFTLYSDTAVNGSYSTSEGSGTILGDYFWVTNNLSGSEKYYRLKK